MKKQLLGLSILFAGVLLLTSCGTQIDGAAKAVEGYITGLVEKNAEEITLLSCGDWESQAMLELDSFQAVETELQDLACTSTLEEDGSSTVTCTGKILVTYNAEVQEFDLSLRKYLAVEEGGEYLVCGYR
jgi:hypothetical protein